MNKHGQKLLVRLKAIALAVKGTGRGLALLGLGSAGMERNRLDDYSDLDFFVITKPGEKRYFLDSLAWLETVQPVVFSFQNTADGYKVLFADGIFCETAVLEPEELWSIPYSGARVIWQKKGSELTIPPANGLLESEQEPGSVEWLVNEILSNLYVGLGRFWRGEKLSAARFIQVYAVDRFVELLSLIEDPGKSGADPFDRSRRFEQRFPTISKELHRFFPGYDQSPRAALAVLEYLESKFQINIYMKEAILARCVSEKSDEDAIG